MLHRKGYFLVLVLVLVVTACSGNDDGKEVKQGVRGKVEITTGNCMPMAGSGESSCKTKTYKTPTKIVIKQNNETVKQSKTVNGRFEVELPVGTYSSYVIYEGKEYCNSSGSAGECSFTVEKDQVANHVIEIDNAVH